MPASILLVDADREALFGTMTVLTKAGYIVTPASAFTDAKRELGRRPDLVIADVRLGEFNGLHVLARARHENPHCRAILTHAVLDPVLEAEARRFGAVYMVKPMKSAALLAEVSKLLQHATELRRWARKAVAGDISAQVEHSPATIVDLTYAGLQLKLPEAPRGGERSEVTVTLPSLGLTMRGHLIWAHEIAAPSRVWRCGVEIGESDRQIPDWKKFVDSLN